MATDISPSALLDFAKAIASGGQSKSGARLATVTRIDESGTAYVQLPGGEEAPIATTGAAYSIGDVVSVSMYGGKLRTVDNISAPSVSERVVRAAIRPVSKAVELAKAAASEADRVATAINQHFWADDNGIHVTEADHDATTEHNILINSVGILLRKATNYLVSITQSAIAFYDGNGNSASNVVAQFGADGVQIGKSSAAHSVIDANGQRVYMYVDGPLLLANIGYGEGASATGTANAPYYSMGLRTPRSLIGTYSMAEGYNTTASGSSSHAEGVNTVASGKYAHAEGVTVTAGNDGSHAEGGLTSASGMYSHAEGQNATASGYGSHAEGYGTSSYYATASGSGAHAEGYALNANIVASGDGSHAEGVETQATARGAHSEGISSIASGWCSHAQNYGTRATSSWQTAIGKYNVPDANNAYALIVGNGSSDSNRSNALTVDWDGDINNLGGRTFTNALIVFGYVTGSGKTVQLYAPLPGFAETVTATGTGSFTLRGGTGATLSVSVAASSITTKLTTGFRNLFEMRFTLSTAFAGGNDVSVSGFVSGLTLTF